MVQAQNERADFFVATAAVDLDQILDGEGKFIFAGVVRLKLFVQRLVGELAGFTFVQDGELRVEAEFVEMFADESQAKAVERADVRDVEKRELASGQSGFVCRACGGGLCLRVSRRRRWRSSAAAASVKVTMSSSSSDARSRSRQSRQRATSVLVLPVPAPAMTRTLPRASTACRWDGVSELFWVRGGSMRAYAG